MPYGPVTGDITNDMEDFLDGSAITQIHVLAWSLGATAAARFAVSRPEMVKSICLISIKQQFPAEEAEKVIRDIRRNRRETLEKFHRLCFTGQKKDYAWFQQTLQKETIEQWDRISLEAGLEFLVANPFDTSVFQHKNVWCFHGSRDIVAPLEQSPCSGTSMLNIIKGAGHLPFLTDIFSSIYDPLRKKQDS